MTHDAWPSSDATPGPLPRIEDLPISEQGYDQESVRQAFDSFYRHAAQLDASLRALESVEVFRRDADALRNDLRALRALGLGGDFPERDWAAASRYDAPRGEVPVVVLRLAAEAALIVAVAVIAGVAHFRPVVIVVLMAAAFAIVALSEWLAGRARFVPPAVAFLPPALEGEPAPYVEAPAPPWGGAAEEPDEVTEPEALTVVASADEVEAAAADDPAPDDAEHDDAEPDAALDPWEQTHDAEVDADDGAAAEAVAGPEGEPELADRAGLFRRRRR